MKKKFYKMDKLRTRTKLEIGLVTLFLVLLIIVTSVGSINRTISSSHDDINTFIRNSNGNYWDATASNLQAAIDDLGSNGGIVWLPNTTIMVKQVWFNETNITLKGYNSCIKLDETKALQFADGQGVLTIQADFTTVDGVEIDGSMEWNGTNLPAVTTVNINGIKLNSVENCTIRNCEVHHTQFNGIEMHGSWHNLIEYNHVHHIGNISDTDNVGSTGIRGKATAPCCRYNIVQYNYVHDIREHGIKFYEDGSNPLDPLHNKILYNTVGNVNMGDWDGDGNPYGACIVVPSCYNLIQGNTLLINDLCEGGIQVRQHNTVVGNIIRDKTSSNGIAYIQVSQGNCIVSYNNINGADLPPYSGGDKTAIGIKLDRASNCTITGNYITHCRYPIHIHSKSGDPSEPTSAAYNVITNNILFGGSVMLKTDNDVVPGTVQNFIANNDLQGLNDGGEIEVSGTAEKTNNIIKGNIGYEYSSYQYIPVGDSNPYSDPSAGAMWLNNTTGELGIYNGYSWIWK
ncbi:MAG: right-handed parallel beta-helix repeat-containing protein [Atribacterota bacterium]